MHPDKETYFRPILDALDYQPSTLENIPNVVIVEGKNDFYMLKYFERIVLLEESTLNILPGTGANDLDTLVSLYLGWGRDFVILLDADNAGKSQKERYIEEWLLSSDRVLTLADIDATWDKLKLEGIFDIQSIQMIKERIGLQGEHKLTKKQLARFLQERYANGETLPFDENTKGNFSKILSLMRSKLHKE